MDANILRVGDRVRTTDRYLKEFGSRKRFKEGMEGTVTGIVPDEDGEFVFVDHSGIDIHWLEKVDEE